jgi:hypothetical protein
VRWHRWFLSLVITASSGWCVAAVQRVHSQEQQSSRNDGKLILDDRPAAWAQSVSPQTAAARQQVITCSDAPKTE